MSSESHTSIVDDFGSAWVAILLFLIDMSWQERITTDPKILVGKPAVKGTRISVEFVLELVAAGWTSEQILDSYPKLTPQDIHACLQYAGELHHSR